MAKAVGTARMNPWLLVDIADGASLFGFAEEHQATGGLSWVLSTPVAELDEVARWARTASGQMYSLGERILTTELDEEGSVALRLLLSLEDYPGRESDRTWVMTRKMARHLKLEAPQRADPKAVARFVRKHIERYLASRSG